MHTRVPLCRPGQQVVMHMRGDAKVHVSMSHAKAFRCCLEVCTHLLILEL